jgi:FtsP/CotA-like multicopper oxidase with cupredoxin domain
MRVLKRTQLSPTGQPIGDVPLPPGERDGLARRDTIAVGPSGAVDVFVQFRDFTGSFVFHCHNLEHEDMAMMGRFDVT